MFHVSHKWKCSGRVNDGDGAGKGDARSLRDKQNCECDSTNPPSVSHQMMVGVESKSSEIDTSHGLHIYTSIAWRRKEDGEGSVCCCIFVKDDEEACHGHRACALGAVGPIGSSQTSFYRSTIAADIRRGALARELQFTHFARLSVDGHLSGRVYSESFWVCCDIALETRH
jgi:hypothetical protein